MTECMRTKHPHLRAYKKDTEKNGIQTTNDGVQEIAQGAESRKQGKTSETSQ